MGFGKNELEFVKYNSYSYRSNTSFDGYNLFIFEMFLKCYFVHFRKIEVAN